MPGGGRSRCSYSGCERPEVSRKFYTIEEGSSAGGQDWTSVVGEVLCNACYKRFKRSGKLERSLNKPLEKEQRRCTYKHCDSPTHGSDFYQIKEGKSSGGQDWSSLVGEVLCEACYKRFKDRGTLERSQNKPLKEEQRRCTYKHCDSPTHGSRFYQIKEGSSAGGQDWTSVVGEVLCNACYKRFKDRGTLERSLNKPLKEEQRRCTYKHCHSPTESSDFYQIKEGKSTGGQDWSSVVGEVLCKACYERFKYKGSLERSIGKPLDGRERRCTYKHCDSPTHGSDFFQIKEGKSAGGQDWSSVVGEVLCNACYKRFKDRGTLERSLNKPLEKEQRRCTYKHCDSPAHGSNFYQIKEGKSAGGQDWSSLVGEVLCNACYCRFKRGGTIEHHSTHVRKKHKTPAHKSSAPSKQAQPHAPSSKHKEEEQDEDKGKDEVEDEPDTGECMVCLDDSRSMCIVPCGHFGLCPSCGDEGLFAGKKRPYSTCPICCEEMCEPYVMERWVWEELGGTTYDS